MIHAQFGSSSRAAVIVTLDEHGSLGGYMGPGTMVLPWPAPGNVEADALRSLVEAGSIVIAPAEPAPAATGVPASISDRQFAQALADLGAITRPEALDFVARGEVPAALKAAIDAIPDEAERFAAEMQVRGATTFERAHSSTLALAQALGWSAAQMDDLWRRAAAL